ncbi:MAG: putative LPS assembly protein LptD [Prevotellamassilia sp.]|uniref:putative LPS assembly protein LptD n=1 Tax=Alloprevotella sp. TaxID=1872471 RepID=UPI002EA6C6D9|nr:putative LPS assembly protein LptD [Prevotellamassilia sp.]
MRQNATQQTSDDTLQHDTARQQPSAVPFSVSDSLKDSLLLPDATNTRSGRGLRYDSTAIDTTAADSAKRKPGIDAPVDYECTDSLVYDAETRLVHLYGKAQVKYMDMTLNAAKITMNMDSSMVRAAGERDTAGILQDKPVYSQGSDNYHSELMAFNFKTKKGYITNVETTQGDGFMQSQHSKRAADGTLYLEHAKYTTCDAKHPHFYIALSRAKVRPGKESVFGPAYLVVADVPLPLAVPYGFLPFNKKYSSGFIMPSYGDETSRGFYLRDGGYYFAINDYMDVKALGEIYTKGSWGLSAETNYRKRYRYNGNFYISFLRTVDGEKNMPDYAVTKSLKVQWTHSKDAKASPNTTFSARVNFASENYERSNLESMYNPLAYTQSTRASSVSFSHTFPSIGLNIAGSTNLTQSLRDSSVSMTLPDLSISLNRFYPFRRKHQAGKERWYEKISMSYTGSLSNSINTKEDKLFKSNLVKDWRNGMQHRIPIDATFQVFKYINISPQFSLRDIMYTNRVMRSWDETTQKEVADTTYGFYNLYDWSLGVSANTTLYGFYKPWRKLFGDKIIAVRHVFKPSVSFSYAPDFTSSHYGYQRTYVKTDANGEVSTVTYSPYSGGIYSYPSGTKQGMITMSVSNNVEMKVKSDRDTTGERKISIIDELYGALSYNMAAETRPWSNLNTRIRLKLTKNYTFSMAAVFATYAYAFDKNGRVVTSDRTEWSYGRFGRFQGMSQNLSYTFNNETLSKLFSRRSDRSTASNDETDTDTDTDAEDANIDPDLRNAKKGGKQKKQKAKVDEDGYLRFSLPWSFTVSYGISMAEDRSKQINVRRMRYPYSFTQTMNFSGYLRIAEGWNISFTSGYDFNYHELSMTTASVSRDLHCFEMSCSVVLRPYSSFNFTFRARANELADALKWDKRSSYSSNIEWY